MLFKREATFTTAFEVFLEIALHLLEPPID